MGWTTPTDRTTGYTVTAADWNIVEDDLSFLYGDTGWTNVSAFTNSWVAGSVAPAYILIGRVVWLRGDIQSGTAGTVAFTLPSGYRPSAQMVYPANISGGVTVNQIVIASTGTVILATSSHTFLSNINFPTV